MSQTKVKLNLKHQVPLSFYSTFGIGGPAKYFVEIKNIESAKSCLNFIQETKIPYLIIGKGSNILFDDRGFNGLVILNKLRFCEIEDTKVHVGSGFSFSYLGKKTAKLGLSGLEFASGIPGSVGGAVFMNAGASGQETSERLISVGFLDESLQVHEIPKDDLSFSYRCSSFHRKKGLILYANFLLKRSDKAALLQSKQLKYRLASQPYSEKSCGCMFTNPKGFSAGQLIELCGLKGQNINGAYVSDLHGNFIVNKSAAKAQDVLALVKLVKNEVYQKKGIELVEEIRYIPYDSMEL